MTMAAMSMSSPLTSLNPTSTEHDWRFPRRPNDDADSGADAMKSEHPEDAAVSRRTGTASSSSPNKTKNKNSGADARRTAGLRDTVKQLRFDLSDTVSAAQTKLSKTQAFTDFSDGIAGMNSSPEDLAKDDPLATQVWRFYAKTKQNLPNQERLENLTWRMMAVNLRKQSQTGDESNRYATHVSRRLPERSPQPTPPPEFNVMQC